METLAQEVVTASPSDRTTTMFGFVAWEEVFVSSDKGRREVHYYLKREDGSSDLAVIGKERSLRHMSYGYAIRNRALVSPGPFSSLPKLKSRRDVIDWLDSIVSDLQQSHQSDCFLDVKDDYQWDTKSSKDIQLRKSLQRTREFSWLGSPWTCRKRRRHFQSFCRNGIEISVYDFVYVLAEEDQRLVAYLEDMYEDSRGSKMVVVRWFHKIDEVDIALPHHFNDREIFFSLCLQDLSIECIDGLAVVLSPQHFEKFLSEAISTKLEPYLCRKQFDNDDIKPFDITQVKGYWKQEILRYMYTLPSLKPDGASEQSDGADDEETENTLCVRAKRRWLLSDDDMNHNSKKWKDRASHQLQCLSSSMTDDKGRTGASNQNGDVSTRILARKETQQKSPLYLAVGSQVEVLSQDSGIRGCWFRAKIIKKHKDKMKIQYQDLQDADDESNKLVEWISATRVAAPDHLGLRFSRRPTIRPPLQSNKGIVALKLGIGSVVDVWWHDGWWEGIVVQRESEDKLQVHFPGEKKESTFGSSDLRLSREWLGSGWMDIKERPDIAATLSSVEKQKVGVICDTSQSRKDESTYKISCLDAGCDNKKGFCMVPDLSKDNSLSKLKWSSSRKRSHINVITFQKPHFDVKRSRSIFSSRTKESFFISTPLKVDHENCKQIEEFPFCSSVVAPLTSLVMSSAPPNYLAKLSFLGSGVLI